MVAMIGSSIACQSIEYERGFNAKHIAWAGQFNIVHYFCTILIFCDMILIYSTVLKVVNSYPVFYF